MDDYTLCSSSTEQGEIPAISVKRLKGGHSHFPRSKSQLQYLYLPGTSLFIGSNTIPKACDYQPSTLTIKLKKKLRQDLPYPFLCLPLTLDKAFFESRFLVDSEIVPVKAVSLDLAGVRGRIVHVNEGQGAKNDMKRETRLHHIKEGQNDGYKEICQDFISGKLLAELNVGSRKNIRIIIKDSILNNLKNRDVYTHFTVQKKDDDLYVVFNRSYIREIGYYEYLAKYGEEVIRSLKSSEIRAYSNSDSALLVCSFTTFHDSCEIQRLFSGIDVRKSVDVAVGTDNVRIVRHPDALADELELLFGIDFTEGEYTLNSGKIYRIDPNGEKFVFNGFSFSGFLDDSESTHGQ